MTAHRLQRTVVLVGLMGAGKTSVGKRLAELLGVAFFDSDDEIEAAAGMTIPEIFDRYGEAEFRRGEAAVLNRLVEADPCVLSTGGGAFIQEENRALINGAGVSVWLNVALDLLWSRVQDKSGRPLLATSDPFGALRQLYDERLPIYQLADVEVDSSAKETHEDVARNIIRALVEFEKKRPDQKVFELDKTDG